MPRGKSAAIAAGVLALLLAVGFRFASASASDFGAEDLERFETRPYGIDLPDWYEDVPFLLVWSRGDGQAFVTIAGDPLARGPVRELGLALYRYHRLGYSMLGRVAVGGMHDLIPIGLLIVNAAGVFALGYLSVRRTSEYGARSLLLLVNPAIWISFASDTSEITGLLLLTLALTAARQPAARAASFLLGAVRPTYAVALFSRRRPWTLVASVGAAVVLIEIFGRFVLGLPSFGLIGLGLPFTGYIEAWPLQTISARLISLGLLGAATLTTVEGIRRKNAGFVLGGLFILTFGSIAVEQPVNLLRAAAFLPVLWIYEPANTSAETLSTSRSS